MSNGFSGPGAYGPDPFGDFLSRFLGGGPRRGPQQVDISRLMSEPARQLVGEAAAYAAQRGSDDLDTQHLLRAALAVEPTRGLLKSSGVDPDRMAEEIDSRVGPPEADTEDAPRQTSLAVTPAAKRALLDARELARTGGAGYIGPEHVLAALAANPDSAAGHILDASRFAPGRMPGPGAGAMGAPEGRPRAVEEHGAGAG
ncbi:Clp protease N-terminal domain-containing protein, partial [Streptomyces sp. 8L]|uniref:Clp protease N-terminal domain-containing protein n=1 Tax=Streptomyces sp. 8L TaxID=2877242 RepID=UPI0027DEF1C4